MEKKYPFYIKFTTILLGLTLLIIVLTTLKDIFIPLAFSVLIAILLNPIVNFLQQRKVNNILAICLAILLAFLIMAGVMYFLSSQIINFGDELPAFKQKLGKMFADLQNWLQRDIGVPVAKQNQWLEEAQTGLKPVVTRSLGTVLGSLSLAFLVPVYVFLFLYYKKLMVCFLHDVFKSTNNKEIDVMLHSSKGAVQQYMVGLLLEALIVAIMNSAALFILGVKYALLLGIIGAILNMLPYIGGVIAIALPVLIATVTKDGYSTQIGVVIAYLVIQFIDNHFLIPWVVSSKVKINALISIVVVFFWGYFWGISGMFLSIPITGVLKIIFDRIPELKPWGNLLGDETPAEKQKSKRSLVKKIIPDTSAGDADVKKHS